MRRRPLLMPEALMQFSPRGFRLGLPMPAMLRSYSLEDQRQYGLPGQSEWRIPLVSAVF